MTQVNNTKKCDGLWTRIDGEKKSILDLTIVNTEAYEMVISMMIDSDSKHIIESKRSIVDRRVTIMEVEIKNDFKHNTEKKTIRINKKDNWEVYRKTLDKN